MISIHPFKEEYIEYIALDNMAGLYPSQRCWNDVKPLYVKALSLVYFLHENSHNGQLANIINELADLYFIHKRHSKTESLYFFTGFFKSQIKHFKYKVFESFISLFNLNIFIKHLNTLDSQILVRKPCNIYNVDTS